ncbi:hypothetical protein T07_389 [Trichinella nelsoni]|uniref:Uncharacterized protein n=1 Tax=Trichinella nelsoni TaxID=6336 RepID=A0A0V0RCP6_9BILA|nr:hypothetical protein T07_7005 [Trichinella nelsoni]KRX20725.1 hypothetical protein T07_389 [Trichinella nelsoni]
MYHSDVSSRSSDLRALLIAGFIRRVSFVNNGWRELKETPSSKLENSVPSNHVRRERKETIEQLKILYLPITFGVSEKRLLGQMLDAMLSDTPPRQHKSSRGWRASAVPV